jgi:hypothetical protein
MDSPVISASTPVMVILIDPEAGPGEAGLLEGIFSHAIYRPPGFVTALGLDRCESSSFAGVRRVRALEKPGSFA